LRIVWSVRIRAGALLLSLALLAGCGSSGGGLQGPKIGAARSFALAGFSPGGQVRPGVPTELRFHINQPSGATLTKFKRGAGPHTGVHLILVRSDLSAIIHRHPAIAPDGSIAQKVTFPTPGPWHVLVDVYPDLGANFQPNFQLTQTVHVAGAYAPKPLPAFRAHDVVGGSTFTVEIPKRLRALRPSFFSATVRDSAGKPAHFTPWYGALAHVIFFHKGSLAYFHTHVCGPGAPNCTSNLGAASKITSRSSTPGKLQVGVLLPAPGVWRMFVQAQVHGKVVTAPFTLKVS
jgi:hypothetical protein